MLKKFLKLFIKQLILILDLKNPYVLIFQNLFRPNISFYKIDLQSVHDKYILHLDKTFFCGLRLWIHFQKYV